MGYFDNCRLARMSDGHYCFMRDLGPVKGGKGMKHHEVVVDLTFRGVIRFFRQLRVHLRKSHDPSLSHLVRDRLDVRGPPR